MAQVGKIDARPPVTFGGNAKDLLTAAKALGVRTQVKSEGEWVSTTAGDSTVVVTERGIPGDALGMVPNVLGMGLKDAIYILENRGLRVRVTGSGMVRKQSLQPGSRCFKGSLITLDLTT